MPHCIIEYTRSIEQQQPPAKMIDAVHQGAVESGLFNAADIKVRSIAYDNVRIGDIQQGQFVHVMARILAGRNSDQKRTLSSAIYQQLQQLDLKLDALTVEICDIERASHQPCPD